MRYEEEAGEARQNVAGGLAALDAGQWGNWPHGERISPCLGATCAMSTSVLNEQPMESRCLQVCFTAPSRSGGNSTVKRRGVQPKGMFGAFAIEAAAVRLRVPQQIATFHQTRTEVCSAPRGALSRPWLRRKSRTSSIAAARLPRHSSRVFPWPLASGTSGQKAMNHLPSR